MNPLPMLVIIPAWNEEAVIGPVLAEITSAVRGLADVLVVSDGSTDATASIAREAGVVVLDLPLNLGVGGAMRAGYLYAARNGYEYAVQTDADGQHNPAEIPAMLECMRETGADVVIGGAFRREGRLRGPGTASVGHERALTGPVPRVRHPAHGHDVRVQADESASHSPVLSGVSGGVPRGHHRGSRHRCPSRSGCASAPRADATTSWGNTLARLPQVRPSSRSGLPGARDRSDPPSILGSQS